MTDAELKRALAELSGVRSETEPIVSLYLDTSWTDEKQRERARLFVQEAAKRTLERYPARRAGANTLERIARVATGRIGAPESGGVRGWCAFACASLGLWRELTFVRPFRNQLCADERPHLLQLAHLADDVEPALLVFVFERGITVCGLALGGLVDEVTIENTASRRQGARGRARGGTGATAGLYDRDDKDQRHAEELLQRVRREAVDFLVRRFDRDSRQHVVLIGAPDRVAELERLLPERLRAAVLLRLPRLPGRFPGREYVKHGRYDIVRRTVDAILERERVAEAKHVEHAIGEAMRGGMAVLGPEDVVLAVNERRVYRLILEEDFERSGWRCRACGALGATHDAVCAFCQGPLAQVAALGEELVGRVLAEDGEVEVVAHTNRLHSYAGVAALLRQGRANGLSGRLSAPAGG